MYKHIYICYVINYKNMHILHKHRLSQWTKFSHTTDVISVMFWWSIHLLTPAHFLKETEIPQHVFYVLKFSHSGNVTVTYILFIQTSYPLCKNRKIEFFPQNDGSTIMKLAVLMKLLHIQVTSSIFYVREWIVTFEILIKSRPSKICWYKGMTESMKQSWRNSNISEKLESTHRKDASWETTKTIT